MRTVLILALVAGCGDNVSADGWTVVDRPEVAGIDLHGASGLGEQVWVLGSRGDDEPGALVLLDGDDWSVIDLPAQGRAVFAAASDDVWITTESGVWRWDRADWTIMNLPINDGEEVMTFGDVGGTGSDDVWISVETTPMSEFDASTLYRWNGAAFERYDGFSDLVFPSGVPPSYVVGMTVGLPCDMGDGTRLSAVTEEHEMANDGGWLLRFDGVAWTLEGEAPYGGSRLVCDGPDLWRLATADIDTEIDRWRSGTWHEIELETDGWYEMRDLRTEDGQAWILGAEILTQDSPGGVHGPAKAQVWLVTDDVGVPTMNDRIVPTASNGTASVHSIWQTASGRLLVFGDDGLVLER